MASSIILRTISSVDDKRIGLQNSQIARTLSIGNSWTKIRIGMRISVLDTAGNLPGNPIFAVGMCSGLTNIFGDATCTNFVGVIPGSSAVISRQDPGSDARYLTNPGGYHAATKVGSTITRSASVILDAGEACFTALAGSKRGVWAVEIEKGDPNYTVQLFGHANNSFTDVSLSTFMGQMNASVMSVTNHNYGTARTIACSEAAGNFDSVNISWDVSATAMEISDLAITRLS